METTIRNKADRIGTYGEQDISEGDTCECAYCGKDIPGEVAVMVPRDMDDEDWAETAKYHDEECDWVRTCAHTQNV